MNARGIRPKFDGARQGFHKAFLGVMRQAGHQVQAGCEAVRLEQFHGVHGGPGVMTSSGETKNFVVEGLSADFNGPDAAECKNFSWSSSI